MKYFDVISFHPGTQHSFEQANQLSRFFQSYQFVTSLCFPAGAQSILPPFLRNALGNRFYHFSRNEIVQTYPFYELKRIIKGKLGFPGVFLERNERFGKWLANHYAPPKFCIGFDTASRYVFERWKGKSFLILDLTVALPQYRLKLELGEAFTEAAVREERKPVYRLQYEIYSEETKNADLILCGSEFVKQSCLEFGVDESKLSVLPYAVDLSKFNYDENLRTRSRQIKFIFVGNVGYRKGVPVLMEAWKNLIRRYSNIEIHFYGRLEIEVPSDMPGMTFHGFVDQNQLAAALNESDIFVFPSHFEGSACVTYEAMAMKLAVITTPGSGSIVEHDKTGLIVNPDSLSELENAMALLIENPGLREELSENAYQKAKDFSWDEYGKKLHDILRNQRLLPLAR